MIAIGVGGLEAATVMAGAPFDLNMPKVVKINLRGHLKRPYVTAMDVILTILKLLTVKGGVGKIIEYGGDGVGNLSINERATITNMGAEIGATTSIFPSDEVTRRFLKAQGREADWVELKADEDAQYSEVIEIDLATIEPMVACPHSPDNVRPIRELTGKRVHQVCIGSCTNSSYQNLKTVALILKGRVIHPDVNLVINPGSRQVYEMLSREGLVADMIAAGARILEASCGPCIGMGAAPGSGQVSVRSYNRNFKGRSGTRDAEIYLASPVACAVMAIKGIMIDPKESGLEIPIVEEPLSYPHNDSLLLSPSNVGTDIKVIKGPNIREVPLKSPLADTIHAEVLLKVGDNITTDDIMPAGSKVLPLRSNIPVISEFVFRNIDESFSRRALALKDKGGCIVVGGENYGQGSSREHAALAPMYLGLQAVIAKSFARIHRSNLINFGILPLLFSNPSDYDRVKQGDILTIEGIIEAIKGPQEYLVKVANSEINLKVISNLNSRERSLILAGGLLAYTRQALRHFVLY